MTTHALATAETDNENTIIVDFDTRGWGVIAMLANGGTISISRHTNGNAVVEYTINGHNVFHDEVKAHTNGSLRHAIKRHLDGWFNEGAKEAQYQFNIPNMMQLAHVTFHITNGDDAIIPLYIDAGFINNTELTRKANGLRIDAGDDRPYTSHTIKIGI